jgi:hypothetical protein
LTLPMKVLFLLMIVVVVIGLQSALDGINQAVDVPYPQMLYLEGGGEGSVLRFLGHYYDLPEAIVGKVKQLNLWLRNRADYLRRATENIRGKILEMEPALLRIISEMV